MTDSSVNGVASTPHNYILSVLCMLFGIGTWLPVNAIYTQMPIFTQYAAEGWSLPSYFSLLTQFANVAPLLYYAFQRRLAPCQPMLICFFLVLGTMSTLALSFTYDITAPVFGEVHSICFFIFSFGAALVGCVSAVLFLPFMNKLPEVYLVPFFIGEGLSGLIPSGISAVQGIGHQICENKVLVYEKPVFTTGLFLILISCVMLLSTLAFVYLNYFFSFATAVDVPAAYKSQQEERSNQNLSIIISIALLVSQTVINSFSNGILPSVQSYSCLPYGALAYHWSIVLNQITSPLVMYIAFFLPLVSLRVLSTCMVVLIACWVYEMLTAFMSPTPPLTGTFEGAVIIVLVWLVGHCLISYTKLSIAAILRRRSEKGLINYGLVTQLGSAIGAVMSFVLINYIKVLHSVPEKVCS